MRKLPTFYWKVTEFLKPYNLEGLWLAVFGGVKS
mgnify:FL=1